MKISAALLAIALALPLAADQSALEQGRAALNKGDYQAAADLLEKAVAQAPNSSEAHLLLGEAYGSLAQKANIFSQASLARKTFKEFDKAVQLDPKNLDARMGLMQFYVMAPGIAGGDNAKGAQQANEIKKQDALRGHRAWAFIYAHDKKPDLVRKEWMDAVKEQPSSPKTHYALAAYYLTSEKNNKAAAEEFEAALKLDPTYMPAVFQIGHMAALNGTDYARGEEALRKYLAYSPKPDEPSLARAHYWLGMIYEKQGKRAEARQSYATSLRLNSTQKDAQEALRRVS